MSNPRCICKVKHPSNHTSDCWEHQVDRADDAEMALRDQRESHEHRFTVAIEYENIGNMWLKNATGVRVTKLHCESCEAVLEVKHG